jgi:YVTN family beta-propeller protein
MLKKLIILIAIMIQAGPAFSQNYAYVVNGSSETLSRIDLETGQVQNHIVILGAVPNHVVCYESKLYVVNSFSPSLMVINPANNSIEAEIQLPLNSNPWNVAVYGNYAYVTALAKASVYKLNLAAEAVVDTFAVGQAPEGVIVYDNRLYVTNTAFNPYDLSYGQGSVSILDIANGGEIGRVNVSKNPQALAVGPDGLINVICSGDYDMVTGMIYFIDPGEMMAVDSLATGGNPVYPVIDRAGIGFISAGGWFTYGYVFSYDAVNHTLLRGDANPIEVSLGSYDIAIDSLGYIYSAGQMANSVTKFDYSGAVIRSFNVGAGPVSIAIMDSRTSINEEVSVPDKFSLKAPYPNPFNSSVVIPYEGEIENSAVIEVFDITGRLVQKLSILPDNSINRNVIWNGSDIGGKKVASGIYFARLAGTSKAVKMVLLR